MQAGFPELALEKATYEEVEEAAYEEVLVETVQAFDLVVKTQMAALA